MEEIGVTQDRNSKCLFGEIDKEELERIKIEYGPTAIKHMRSNPHPSVKEADLSRTSPVTTGDSNTH